MQIGGQTCCYGCWLLFLRFDILDKSQATRQEICCQNKKRNQFLPGLQRNSFFSYFFFCYLCNLPLARITKSTIQYYATRSCKDCKENVNSTKLLQSELCFNLCNIKVMQEIGSCLLQDDLEGASKQRKSRKKPSTKWHPIILFSRGQTIKRYYPETTMLNNKFLLPLETKTRLHSHLITQTTLVTTAEIAS